MSARSTQLAKDRRPAARATPGRRFGFEADLPAPISVNGTLGEESGAEPERQIGGCKPT